MRLPEWIRKPERQGALHGTKSVLRRHGLATVCEEARCPNKSECFSKPTATFMILGDECTRACAFCSVKKSAPRPPDAGEPRRVAEAAKEMGLKFVVVTSPTRDDLPDGGASHFAETVRELRSALPKAGIEVLTPDFRGDLNALKTVVDSRPDVFNHNVETVPSLYPKVRPQADYKRSLMILAEARASASEGTRIKSGLMLGFGETMDEVRSVMRDLREAGCGLLTIGQYLRPRRENISVVEYVNPEIFGRLRDEALRMGFLHCASSPFARSSMNAEEVYGYVNV